MAPLPKTSSTAHGDGWRQAKSHASCRRSKPGWTMAHGETTPHPTQRQAPQTNRRRGGRKPGARSRKERTMTTPKDKLPAHLKTTAVTNLDAMADTAEGQGPRGGAGQALPPPRSDGESERTTIGSSNDYQPESNHSGGRKGHRESREGWPQVQGACKKNGMNVTRTAGGPNPKTAIVLSIAKSPK